MEENKFDSLLNSPAAPQDASTAAFVAESRENRERCYEMSEQMTREVAGDAGAFQKYLDLQSHFDRYGANNVLLIMAQMPGAERIGDYGYWKEKGAYLKKQERKNPILILEPGKEYEREDGSIGTYYNAKKVYDISQTTMDENIPGNSSFSPELKDSQLIRALVSSPPAAIVATEPEEMPEGKGALFEPEEECIYVRKGMDAQDIFRSLTPELALAGFAGGDKGYDRSRDAFHAYCASYMLCRKYGVDARQFDFSEVPGYFEGMEPKEVRGELSKARDAANRISERMEKVLRKSRETGQRADTQQTQTGREAR